MIVAFGYRKRSGKDTAAKLLDTLLRCERPGFRVRRAAFADKLKDICFQLYSWADLQRGHFYESHQELKEVVLPRLGKSPRQIWIEVGNYMREVYPLTWIDFVLASSSLEADVTITSDLRYCNEAYHLKERGAVLIKIESQERLIREGVIPGTDPAEVDLDGWNRWDYVIPNNGTLKEFSDRIITLAGNLKLIGG